VESVCGSRAETGTYGLDGLEYGYEEEYGVDRGHDKELPVWSFYKFRIDLNSAE
jgi:hypothetical protein